FVFDVAYSEVKLLETIMVDSTVGAIFFDYTTKYILIGTAGGYLYSYRIDPLEKMNSFRAHTEAIIAIKYDGYKKRYLTLGYENGVVKVWRTANDQSFRLLLDRVYGPQITMMDQCVITPQTNHMTEKLVRQFKKNGAIIYPKINVS